MTSHCSLSLNTFWILFGHSTPDIYLSLRHCYRILISIFGYQLALELWCCQMNKYWDDYCIMFWLNCSLIYHCFLLQDVAAKIMAFSQNGPRAVCVLSASGTIANVTLRQAATSGGTATYEVLLTKRNLVNCFKSLFFRCIWVYEVMTSRKSWISILERLSLLIFCKYILLNVRVTTSHRRLARSIYMLATQKLKKDSSILWLCYYLYWNFQYILVLW